MVADRWQETSYQHQPVLVGEVIRHLVQNPGGIYLDATFGRGGHARAILDQLNSTGRLLAMDKDPVAISCAHQYFGADKRFSIQQGSFADLEQFLKVHQLHGKVDGILYDLGVSSPQLDDPERGFSFLRAGKLDMRMDRTKGVDAATWLLTVSEQELSDVLWQYGEERYSRRIAKAILAARKVQAITHTDQLAEIIAKAHPAWEIGKHPATRSFQAIRIKVNCELDDLKIGLAKGLDALKIGGRLVVISFHSLEDRIVKQFIQYHERGDHFPAGLPIKHQDFLPRVKKVGKAIKPTPQEIASNPRARSAILRITEKLS